jgi:hypothetical protein
MSFMIITAGLEVGLETNQEQTLTEHAADVQYAVCWHAAANVGRLLSVYTDPTSVFESFLHKVIAPLHAANDATNSESSVMSSLAVMGHLGIHDMARERRTLLELCRILRHRPQLHGLVLHTYRQMSQRLKYNIDGHQYHTQQPQPSFLLDHLPYLLSEWLRPANMDEALPLKDFPLSLFHPSTSTAPWQLPHAALSSSSSARPSTLAAAVAASSSSIPPYQWFIQSYQSQIVPPLVLLFKTHGKDFAELSKLLNVKGEALLERHFAVVFAQFYALYSPREKTIDGEGKGTQSSGSDGDKHPHYKWASDVKDHLASSIPKKKGAAVSGMVQLMQQRMDDILLALFDLAATTLGTQFPHLTDNGLRHALNELAKFASCSVEVLLCKPQSARILKVRSLLGLCCQARSKPS